MSSTPWLWGLILGLVLFFLYKVRKSGKDAVEKKVAQANVKVAEKLAEVDRTDDHRQLSLELLDGKRKL
jgi:hypothetical protein